MYTTLTQQGNVVTQFIEPLDPRIIRLKLTCDLKGSGLSDVEISFFVALLTLKTTTRSKEEIETYLNRHGIEFSITPGSGSFTSHVTVAKRNLKAALLIIEDILLNADITRAEFNRSHKHTLEGIRECKDDARLISRINFHRALYTADDERWAHSIDEQLAILKKIPFAFFKKTKQTARSDTWYISAVADKDAQKNIKRFADSFVSADEVRQVKTHVAKKVSKPRSIYETVPGRTNVELRMGHRLSISQADTEYPALAFGLSILGDYGGFGGRLMSTVREKEGLTYGIYARVEDSEAHNPGFWNIFTFFTAKDLTKGISSTMRELTKLIKDGVTDRECAVFKEMYKNDLLISHESNVRRINHYHGLLAAGLNEVWSQNFYTEIAKLNKKKVHEVLQKHIDLEKVIVSGAGPITKSGKGMV